MVYTTLNKIRPHSQGSSDWAKLLRHLNKTEADDEPLALSTILESNGLRDALWSLRAVDGCDREKRLYAVRCARRVQHLMPDPRSIAALDVAERHANGQTTDEELAEAERVATSRAAAEEELGAAFAAARAAACATANFVGNAAFGAAGCAVAAKWDAMDAERAAQEAEFRRVFCSVIPQQEHA